MILAGLSMPLVFSVHSIVSFDFATSVIPGWHARSSLLTSFWGAEFLIRHGSHSAHHHARAFRLTEYITIKHLENMAKIVTLTGSLVGLAYGTQFFIAWYGGSQFEGFTFINRAFGPYWWSYWIMISCNVISPQLFWFRAIRTNPVALWIISIFVNIGMWFERWVIIVTSLHRDYLPSSWDRSTRRSLLLDPDWYYLECSSHSSYCSLASSRQLQSLKSKRLSNRLTRKDLDTDYAGNHRSSLSTTGRNPGPCVRGHSSKSWHNTLDRLFEYQ